MPQKKQKSHAVPVMQAAIMPFEFEQYSIRVLVEDDGAFSFVATDICHALGLSNVSRAVARLKPNEKGVTLSNTPGGEQSLLTVTEAGLYRLIFRSDKDAAERFQTWVFTEVLPTIRKTGQYTVVSAPSVPIDPVEKYPELRAIREMVVAIAEARDAAHAAEIRAVRAEAKADLAIADAKRMTIEQFVIKNGLLRQFPVSQWRSIATWLTHFCQQYGLPIYKESVPGKHWADENSYPLEAFGVWWQHELRQAKQLGMRIEEDAAVYATVGAEG